MHEARSVDFTDEDVAEVAEEVRADPRTVVRRIARLPVKGRALADDIDAALAARRHRTA